jgi:hypothetical protein
VALFIAELGTGSQQPGLARDHRIPGREAGGPRPSGRKIKIAVQAGHIGDTLAALQTVQVVFIGLNQDTAAAWIYRFDLHMGLPPLMVPIAGGRLVLGRRPSDFLKEGNGAMLLPDETYIKK